MAKRPLLLSLEQQIERLQQQMAQPGKAKAEVTAEAAAEEMRTKQVFEVEVLQHCRLCGYIFKSKTHSMSRQPVVTETSTCSMCRGQLSSLSVEQLVDKLLHLAQGKDELVRRMAKRGLI